MLEEINAYMAEHNLVLISRDDIRRIEDKLKTAGLSIKDLGIMVHECFEEGEAEDP
jgi:hypothetical protein